MNPEVSILDLSCVSLDVLLVSLDFRVAVFPGSQFSDKLKKGNALCIKSLCVKKYLFFVLFCFCKDMSNDFPSLNVKAET